MSAKPLRVVGLMLLANGRVIVTLQESTSDQAKSKYFDVIRDLDEARSLHIDQLVEFSIRPADGHA